MQWQYRLEIFLIKPSKKKNQIRVFVIFNDCQDMLKNVNEIICWPFPVNWVFNRRLTNFKVEFILQPFLLDYNRIVRLEVCLKVVLNGVAQQVQPHADCQSAARRLSECSGTTRKLSIAIPLQNLGKENTNLWNLAVGTWKSTKAKLMLTCKVICKTCTNMQKMMCFALGSPDFFWQNLAKPC